ncbi:hypothetical protein SY2F82_15840 [Streptomyces sp. Y2F8-2]|nr:hypothetical protein SY2F82_15840 [Streptomyces sp. Y2F8-2]
MNSGAYAHPTSSRFAIADGTLHIGGIRSDSFGCLCTPLDLLARDVCLPRAAIGDLVTVFQARRPRDDGQSHSVPRPSDTDGGVGADRRPPGLHDR